MTTKTTRVDFYTAGLNAVNWAYDKDALTGILNSSAIVGGSVTLSAPLAFGVSFYLSFDEYETVKRATYIQIINLYNDATVETRFAFIDDYVEMNNGKWRVEYTLDDWANYVLSGDYPVDIEGFTDRANVGLLANVYDVDAEQEPYTGLKLEYPNEMGRTPHDSRKIYVDATLGNRLASLIQSEDGFENHSLLPGYTCAVYFVSEARYNGSAITTTLSGKLLDIDVEQFEPTPRYIDRKNSRIYFLVFDDQGRSIPIYDFRSTSRGQKQPANSLRINDLEESNVDKIIYFPYYPGGMLGGTDVGYVDIDGSSQYCVYIKQNALDNYQYLSDVAHVGKGYQYGVLLEYFSPVMQVSSLDFLANFGFYPNRDPFEKAVTYDNYFKTSLYRQVSQSQSLKIKYAGAEVSLPKSMIRRDTKVFIGLSGDAESVWIKVAGLRGQGNYNNLASVMPNQNFFDIALSTDYKAFKLAKITGTAQLIGGALNTAIGSAKSIATGGVLGAIGAGAQIAQGAVNLYAGVEKMNGLTPIQQGSANNDYTVVQITNLNDIVFEIERTLEPLETAEVRDYERNGVTCSFEIKEYLRTQRCQAYNTIKMAFIDIHGIPNAPALNISNALLSGVTLWSATSVGNKDVINYQIELPNVYDGPLI